jgi:hypothetical protein
MNKQQAPNHDRFGACYVTRYFIGFSWSKAAPRSMGVFAEGEKGIPKGYSPLAAGGEIT